MVDEKEKGRENENNQEATASKPMIDSSSKALSETATELGDADDHSEDTPHIVNGVEVESEGDMVHDVHDEEGPKSNCKRDSTYASVAVAQHSTHDATLGGSLIGTMTNLVTTDLEIIKMPAGQLLIIHESTSPIIILPDLIDASVM
jgi:hypothetical protein